MIARTPILTVAILLSSALPAASMGSAVTHDDPYNPHHIDDLPSDIRQYVAHICKSPASARHEFAVYFPSDRRWRISLEYLSCSGLGEYRRGNQCLQVDFIGVGKQYRLVSKAYRECGY
jgi:hypothetical protein